MKEEFKRYKSISFKQAWLIVLALHAFALLGFTQWSNYKARLAKELRETRKAELLAGNSSKQDWNNQHIKPKIVAVAPTPKPTPNQTVSSANPLLKTVPKMVEDAKMVFISTQNKATEEIKNAFLNSKKNTTGLAVKTTRTSQPFAAPTNKVYVTSSKPKRIQSATQQPKTTQQTISSNTISLTEPVTISKTTSKTYFINGLDYRTEEQVVQRLSSHIRL